MKAKALTFIRNGEKTNKKKLFFFLDLSKQIFEYLFMIGCDD